MRYKIDIFLANENTIVINKSNAQKELIIFIHGL